MTDLLAVEDVEVSFGGIRALSGVSLQVRRGEIFAIIGPNGAGKTTLFNVISVFVGRKADASGSTGETSPDHRRTVSRNLACRGRFRTCQFFSA